MLSFIKNLFGDNTDIPEDKAAEAAARLNAWQAYCRKRLLQSLELFENGENKYLSEVYNGMLDNSDNPDYLCRVGRAVTKMLGGLSCIEKMRLGECFRMTYYQEYGEHRSCWRAVDISSMRDKFACEQDYISVLIVGSGNTDGYFREKCLRLMAGYDSCFPFVLIRINDWVDEIRCCAEKIAFELYKQCSFETLVKSLPYLDKVLNSGRRNGDKITLLNKLIFERLKSELTESKLEALTEDKDYRSRRLVYRLMLESKLIPEDLMRLLMERERDKFLNAFICIRYIKLYEPDEQTTETLLKSKSPLVRYEAAQYKYARIKNIWDGAECLLTDKCRTIREFAAFIFTEHTDLNVVDFYAQRLGTANCVSALIGIGAYGAKKDAELIVPYLKSGSADEACAAIEALFRLTDSEYAESFFELVFDKRDKVSSCARRVLKRGMIRFGAKRLYSALNTDNEHTRRQLIMLLANEDAWERLPYLLKLYNDNDEQVREIVRMAVTRRNTYVNVNPALAEEIRTGLIECKNLPSELVLMIEMELNSITRTK